MARAWWARGVVVCAIASAFTACGDDEGDDGGHSPRDAGREAAAGNAGRGGSGGSAGSSGNAGSSGGSGTSGSGGSAGARDGGRDAQPDVGADAGAAGSGCGDRVKGPLEQCDDGNTSGGDGCSAQCTLEACDACRRTKCAEACASDAGSGCTPSAISYRECPGLTGDAGQLAAQCSAILQCFRSSGCDRDDPRGCYCGDVQPAACFRPFPAPPSPPNGPCKAVIDALVEPQSVIDLAGKYLNPIGNPVGPAVQGVICELRECASECFGVTPEADGGDASNDAAAADVSVAAAP